MSARDFAFVRSDKCASTPKEPFSLEPSKTGRFAYNASTQFALEELGEGNGRTCLVIGSPLFIVKMLIERGWDATYLDVRNPPVKLPKFIQCDATRIELPDESFDAVETSCVLSHAGMGRYGDAIVGDGDERMLQEMVRVMKPGAPAAIMFGNVADMEKMVVLGKCHRVYTLKEIERLLGKTGFVMEKKRMFSLGKNRWLADGEPITKDFMDKPDYISVLVRKQP